MSIYDRYERSDGVANDQQREKDRWTARWEQAEAEAEAAAAKANKDEK